MTLRIRTGHVPSRSLAEPRQETKPDTPWDLRLVGAVGRLFYEATSTEMLGGMAAGQLIFAPLRATVLSALWNPLTRAYRYAPLLSSCLATGVATAVEAPVFWGTSHGIAAQLHGPSPQPLSFSQAIQEMGVLGATMGLLRIAGFGADTFLRVAPWARANPTLVHTTASVAGLYGVYGLEEKLGWRPDQGELHRGVDALVATLQFAWTGKLAHRLLGRRFQNFQTQLEQVHQSRIYSSLPAELTGRPLAWAGPSPQEGNFFSMGNFPGDSPLKPNPEMAPAEGGQGSPAATQEFILKVLELGRDREIGELKNILREVYSALGFKPGEKVARYFASQDWEDWKTVIRIAALGGQESPLRVVKSLEQQEAFKEFCKKWHAQPHFLRPEQVPLRIHHRLPPNQTAVGNYLRRMQKALWESPSEIHLKLFLYEGRKKTRGGKHRPELLYEWNSAQSPSRKTLYLGRYDQFGFGLEFNEEGYLAPPIHVYFQPETQWMKENLDAFGRGESWQPLPPKVEKSQPPPLTNIPVEFLPDVPRGTSFHEVVKTLKKILGENPNERAIKMIRDHYGRGSKDDAFLPEPVALPNQQKAYVYNRGAKHGLILRFDKGGQIILPIHVGRAFSPEWIEKITSSLQRGEWDLTPPPESSIPTAPKSTPPPPSNPLSFMIPSPPPLSDKPKLILELGDNPTTFGAKLIEKSQDLDRTNQWELSKAVEYLVQSPGTRPFALEMMERVLPLSEGKDPEAQAVVQNFVLEGLDQPLKLFSLPAVVFPEWHASFLAQQLRSELSKTPVNRIVEIGSGNGWLSIYLRKLGLAKKVIAYDNHESSQGIGRVNAVLNGIDWIHFADGPNRGMLQKNTETDLVITSMERVRRMSESNGEDMIRNILYHSRYFLNRRGRVIIQGAGEQERQLLTQLFKKNGYHLKAYLVASQHLDPATRQFLLDGYAF